MGLFKKKKEGFISPVDGVLSKLENVDDEVFSSKMMGDGFAIAPVGEKIYAPLSGIIKVVASTKHAIGITTANGLEYLIHVGLDTVELNGKGFTVYIQEGDTIKQGDLLMEVNLKYIESKNKSIIIPIVFTSGEKIILNKENQKVCAKQKDIIQIK